MKKFDAIIIGSGIGGLICGTKLAKYGFRTLIIEKHVRVGGCVTSCRKRGFNFDYGAHIFGSCNKGGILSYYLYELGITDLNFVRMDPTDRFMFPDQIIEVPQKLDEYIDYLKHRYPDDAESLNKFFKEIIKIARSFSSEQLLKRYYGLTYEQLLTKYFINPELKSILSAQFRHLGSTPKNLAATSMCLMMASYLRDGAYYPKGGAQNVSNAIADKFKEFGGQVLLNTEVVKIETHARKVTGVKTKNGDIFESEVVISNADARRTFFDLIDGSLINKDYLKKISSMRIGSSFFLIFIGAKISDDSIKNKNGWYHSAYGLDLRPTQSMYVFIPSLLDRTVAPPDMHTIELAIPFPYEFETVNWHDCKKTLEDKLLTMAEGVIPNLRKSIIYKESATPKTIERYTYNSRGSICGWSMDADQVHERRLQYNTPFENLYLVGHWTNPGCGVAPVTTSGWIVADKILNRK